MAVDPEAKVKNFARLHCAAHAITAGGAERDAMYDELVEMMFKHSR